VDSAARRRRPLQVFRIASLFVPSALAWEVASMTLHRTRLDEAVAQALAPLWLATLAVLAVRVVDAWRRRIVPCRDALEVLTASGSSMAWTGALAVVASVGLGWASLSVVGLFGLCTLHLVALWTLVRACGPDPWRRESLTRRLVPGVAIEGDAVTEAVSLAAPSIPVGFRLFARGRIGPRWPVSRYVVPASSSGGEVQLESDVGPALRGSHDAEPLEVWLQDVLGLCRSPRVRCGEARLTVQPRPPAVGGARYLLAAGGHDDEPRTALRLPTSGSGRLREYQPGDDARRIHWLRSLAARQIVVRLPDELPPDAPAVRLLLDSYHPAIVPREDAPACRAPHDLLDGLVRVWLGIGRALVERGVRVTLVTVIPGADGEPEPARTPLRRGAFAQGGTLGARVVWQRALSPAQLLTGDASVVVSHRLPLEDAESGARWVVVPAELWTEAHERRGYPSLRLPHPPGSVDNRTLRRREVRRLRQRERADGDAFLLLCAHSQARRAGHFLARPLRADAVRLELLS
jgi:uncharacterized protein (DUF58 family)